MTLSSSIPVRRDPPAGAGAGAGAEGADFSALSALGLLVVVAVFGWAWWRKRKAAGHPSLGLPSTTATGLSRWLGMPVQTDIRLVGSTRLTPKTSLHDVQWQGKRLLIGCSDQSIHVLAQTPATSNETAPTGDST